jgi:HAE1 family hydrophobic/amphiphilic exporter-1
LTEIKWLRLTSFLQTVGMTMQTAYSGNTDGKFRAGEYEYDINIKYSSFDRK